MSDKYSILEKELEKKGLSVDITLSHNEAFNKAADMMHFTPQQLTSYLWTNYHPGNIWIVIFTIGITAAISLWFYNKHFQKKR